MNIADQVFGCEAGPGQSGSSGGLPNASPPLPRDALCPFLPFPIQRIEGGKGGGMIGAGRQVKENAPHQSAA